MENSIMRERKSGVVTIKQTVIRISSVISKWGSPKKSKMEGRKNGVACTIARAVQIKNAFSRSKNNSTVDGNSEEYETYVEDSPVVDCKSCCCSNGKITKTFNESEVEYSPPPGIEFSFDCCHPSLSHQADGFQMLVDSGSSKPFVDSWG